MDLSFIFFFNSIVLGIGLAMDAFSVSLANGMNEPCMKKKKMLFIAVVFGVILLIIAIIKKSTITILTAINRLKTVNKVIVLIY